MNRFIRNVDKRRIKTRHIGEKQFSFQNILNLKNEVSFTGLMFVFVLISSYTVFIDFTIVLSKINEPSVDINKFSCLMSEFMYALDLIYLCDIFMDLILRKLGRPALHILIILLKVTTVIPYEAVYLVMGGTNLWWYQGFRGRYFLRLLRYLLGIKIKKRSPMLLIATEIIKSIIIISIISLIMSCYRIVITCINDQHKIRGDAIKCDNIKYSDIIFAYSIALGEIVLVALNFIGSKFILLSNYCLPIQIGIYMYMFYLSAILICIFIEHQSTKLEYVILSSLSLRDIKQIKRNAKSWTNNNEMFVRFYKVYLNTFWKVWESKNLQFDVDDGLSATIPSVIENEIKLDVSWNMFKHSILFRNEELPFLRLLAKYTDYKYLPAGYIIWAMEEFKTKMIYLVSGVIQVLSPENEDSSIIVFSDGTCLGESSLFISTPSKVTVVCRSQCEIIVLKKMNMIKAKKRFPNIYNQLQERVAARIANARVYDEIGDHFAKSSKVGIKKKYLSLRYIKGTLRNYLDQNQVRTNDIMKFNQIHDEEVINNSVFCSDYIPMYVLANELRTTKHVHFARTGLGFKVHPGSQLVKFWKALVTFLAIILSVVYPITAGTTILSNEDYLIFNVFMGIISAVWLLDFYSFLFIAVEAKGEIYVDMTSICLYRITKIDFWLDFCGSLPIEMIFDLVQGPLSVHTRNFLKINRLLKVFRVINSLINRRFNDTFTWVIVTTFELLFAFIFLILIYYYIFELIGTFKVISIRGSIWRSILEKSVAVFGFIFCIPLSIIDLERFGHVSFWILVILQFLGFVFKYILISKYIAIFSFHYYISVEYQNLVEDMSKVMLIYKCNPQTRYNILHYLRIHFEETRGVFMLKRNSLRLFLGYNIRRIIQSVAYQPLLDNIPLFYGVSSKVIADFCEICDLIYVPKGEVLVYAGMTASSAYIITRGICAIVNHDGDIVKYLYPGEILMIPEVLCKSRVVHNIIALTECAMLAISQDSLQETIVKHTSLYFEIMTALSLTIGKEDLDKWAEEEILTKKELESPDTTKKESFLVFKLNRFDRDFGKAKWYKKFILRFAIRSDGLFWICWEVIHFLFVYVDIFLSSIPITINGDVYSAYFWIYRLIDVVRFADIFLRHYVIYYNENKLEISHPKKTIIHYWKGSFCVDLISSLPLDLLKNLFPGVNRVELLILLRVNRYLQLYRFFGIKRYINYTYMGEPKLLLLLCYAFIMLTVFNLLSFLFLFPNCIINFDNETILCKRKERQFWNAYLRYFKINLKSACNVGVVDEKLVFSLRIQTGINAFLGYLVTLYFTAVYIGLELNRNTHLTAFQVKMRGLVNFMDLQKIDKKLREEIIKHYEHIWFLEEGKTIKHTLKLFNKICYTKVIYSLYGEILQTSILFQGFSTVLLKDYLSNREISRENILIKGIIIRVNDVQNKMYLIIKGVVDVLGPDYSKHMVLTVGSIFGCLDNVSKHRATLNYVAKTHCQLITITSQEFHKFLHNHPAFKRHYMKLLRNSNFDYINNIGRDKRKSTMPKILKTSSLFGVHHRKFIKNLKKIYMVRKPNYKLEIVFVIINFLSFLIECFQKVTKTHTVWIIVLLYILDFLHLFKMYTRFFTTYENKLGLQERGRKHIVMKYLKNPMGFAFDLICILPIDIFALIFHSWIGWTYSRLNRLAKIIFVSLYLKSMRNRLNVNIFLIKSAHIILTYLFVSQILMIVLVHVDMLPKKYDDIFNNYYETLSVQTFLQIGAIFYVFGDEQNNFRVYSKSYSVAFIFNLTISRFLYIYFMAEFASAFQILNFTNFRFQRFYAYFKNSMHNMRVSLPLSKRILFYYEQLAQNEQTVQFPSFLKEAPYYLSEGVMESLFGYHLRNHPIFSKCHKDLLRQLSANFKTIFFCPGDFVAFIGDLDSTMYFVHQGEVEGLSVDGLSYEVSDIVHKDGDYFGLRQMLYEGEGHTFTYKVTKKSIILALKREVLMELLAFFPASKHVIFDSERKYD